MTLNTGLNQPSPIQSSLADKCPKSASLPNTFFIYTHLSILSTTLVLSVLLRGRADNFEVPEWGGVEGSVPGSLGA